MSWKPIIQEEFENIFKQKLVEITKSLIISQLNKLNFVGGKVGISLFLFYYDKYKNEQKYYDKGFDLISEVFDEINKGYSYHTFSSGFAGIGWTINHLSQNNFIDANTNEVFANINEFLSKTMLNDIKNGKYDFLHGAIGTGLYFLNRLPNKEASNYLMQLIDELDNNSEKNADGTIKWEAVLDREKGTTIYDLSLSHGIASIMIFLAKAYKQNIHKEKALYLINGAVKFVLQNKQDTNKYISNFPNRIEKSKQNHGVNSRLAWCYGDLGIGISLYQTAKIINNKDLEKEAIEIFLHSAKRRELKENMVVDAGLCHGTASIAHIYNRMYHYTGIEIFKESAIYWFNETIKMAKFDDGLAGYKAWHGKKLGGWINEYGLLEGIAGIGLSLISAVSDIEPKWDECFLLS